MSDWITPDCAARAVRAMDVTMLLETHCEHIARSKQVGVIQSDSKFKCPFVIVSGFVSFNINYRDAPASTEQGEHHCISSGRSSFCSVSFLGTPVDLSHPLIS